MTYHRIRNTVCFFAFVSLFTFFGCAAQSYEPVWISVPSSAGENPVRSCMRLCQIDSDDGVVQWSRTFETEQLYSCVDTDTVYVGCSSTNGGTICALSPENGECLWQTGCAVAWTPSSDMRFADGSLYYPGIYDPVKQEYPLYRLNVETLEESVLPVGHSPLSGFSVCQGHIYACDTNGVVVYDLETGDTVHHKLPDLEYLFLEFCEDHLTVAYEDRVEWYVISPSGLEHAHGITVKDMGVAQMTVCATSPAAFIFLDRGIGDPWTEANLCIVPLEQGQFIVCDCVTTAPSDVVFTDDGFYAAWEDRIAYYDGRENPITIWTE